MMILAPIVYPWMMAPSRLRCAIKSRHTSVPPCGSESSICSPILAFSNVFADPTMIRPYHINQHKINLNPC
jgi:hypothetical protein